MNHFKLFIIPLMAITITACSDASDEPENGKDLSSKDITLKAAAVAYVDNTVLPTYSAMADASISLRDLCRVIQEKHSDGTLNESDIKAAGEVWKQARKNWELSEAFLFGPAANHNIDPHIESWPLDKAAMDNLLNQIRNGNNWNLE
ncbi:MAG: hypothetical protein K2M16_06175, partial [Muribaculaceae bacterium]|nr:hypothetical protein [Muribaculaceae bacterium]